MSNIEKIVVEIKSAEGGDDAKLFDGYAIMHYDDKNTIKETEKEKKERR